MRIIEPLAAAAASLAVLQREEADDHSDRKLQVCNFYDDLARQEYQCTLSQYCTALAKILPGYEAYEFTCEGDLNGAFTISYQGRTCLDPGADPSWIQQSNGLRVCYDEKDRTEYSQNVPLRRTADYDFVQGFNILYEAEATLCPEFGASNAVRQCGCTATIEGQTCQSCTVCNGGFPSDHAYVYELDCSNIADGMVRGCDESFSWGDFFQRVEDIGVPPPTGVPRPNDIKAVSPEKGLSSATLGGIIGAAVGVGLAVLFAVILIAVLRKNKNTAANKKKGRNNNDTRDSPAGGDIRRDAIRADNNSPAQVVGSSSWSNADHHFAASAQRPFVPMANAVMIDESISDIATTTTKPDFKAQVHGQPFHYRQ